jgi:hypothetical protein
MPNWPGVPVDSRCRIDRIFLYDYRGWRYNHGSSNHDSLGDQGSGLLNNDTRSRSIFVRSFSFIPMNFTVRTDGQIGSNCWRGYSKCTRHTQDRFAHVHCSHPCSRPAKQRPKCAVRFMNKRFLRSSDKASEAYATPRAK